MKVQEIFETKESSKPTMDDLVKKLEKVGGQVYAKIRKGDEMGWLGVNGKGRNRVYFAFYPDGTQQRFESGTFSGPGQLKNGWKPDDGDYRDPDTVLQDKSKEKKIQRERKFTADVRLTDKELEKLISNLGGDIADSWVEDHGIEEIGGRDVAYAEYTIYVKNEDYDEESDEDGHDENGNQELHDPVHFKIWRDPKNPDKYDYEQTDY